MSHLRRGAKCRNARAHSLTVCWAPIAIRPRKKAIWPQTRQRRQNLWRIIIGSSCALRKRLRLPNAILMTRRHRINVRLQF